MAGADQAWQAAALYREISRSQRANARDAQRVKQTLAKGVLGLQDIAAQLSKQFEAVWEAKLAAQQATLAGLQRRLLDPHGIVQANVSVILVQLTI